MVILNYPRQEAGGSSGIGKLYKFLQEDLQWRRHHVKSFMGLSDRVIGCKEETTTTSEQLTFSKRKI